MAEININFLRQLTKKRSHHAQRDRLWFRWSLGLASTAVIISLLVLGINFFWQNQIRSAQADNTRLKADITDLVDVEASVAIMTKKLAITRNLLDQRQEKQQAIDYFTQLFGDQVLLKQIDYAADEGILSLRVEAINIFLTDQIFAQLGTPETHQRYPYITKSDLRREPNGRYAVTITVVVKKISSTPP